MSQTLKLQAEFGTAPVGVETVATEKYWDDYGVRHTYEYLDLDSDDVTATSEWAEWLSIQAFQAEIQAPDPEGVVRFTIQVVGGNSFCATGWVRFPQSVNYINEFLKGLK